MSEGLKALKKIEYGKRNSIKKKKEVIKNEWNYKSKNKTKQYVISNK